MTLLSWMMAVAIGLSLGLLGGGGSILTVPVFRYLLGYAPKEAIAMSLPVVGIAAGVGALAAMRRGTLPVGVAATMGAATMAGSFVGARLATYLDGRAQLAILAVAMLAAAAAMWMRARGTAVYTEVATRHSLALGAVGLGVGLLTGTVGIGGGFMIVPALVIAGGLPMREAQSASLFVIALSATAGFAGYLGQVALAWPVVFKFAAMAAVGVLAGGVLARRVPQQRLQQGFAVFLVVLAGYMLIRR